MKYSADELANKLEEKAKSLRENGLSQEDMDMASGGVRCRCCGTSCSRLVNMCGTDSYGTTREESCLRACIASSPD